MCSKRNEVFETDPKYMQNYNEKHKMKKLSKRKNRVFCISSKNSICMYDMSDLLYLVFGTFFFNRSMTRYIAVE